MKKWTTSFLTALMAALLLYIPVKNLHTEYNKQLYEGQRSDAINHLEIVREDIQNRLDSSLFYSEYFEMIVNQDPDVSDTTLRQHAAMIVERNPLIDSVSLAKDGVIHFVYPVKGNEATLGFNMLEDPEHKNFLEEAIDKKEAIAQGPFNAIQGGRKIVNYKPVIIDNTGAEEMWGFANVTIDFEELIESSLFPDQSHDFAYAIKVESDGSAQAAATIWGEEDIFEADAVTASIVLPENNWTIALIPSNGWDRSNYFDRLETFIFFLFIVIISVIVMFFVHQYFTIKELSKVDALTRLLNKRNFELSTKKVLKCSSKENGLLLIDFNDFKSINDTHGHLVGDRVLSITAERLVNSLKKEDLIGRIGGDEMMILVKDVDAETLECIKERVVLNVERPIVLKDVTIDPSISVGQTLVKDWLPFDHLYDIVDKKMYRHKTITKDDQKTVSFKIPDMES